MTWDALGQIIEMSMGEQAWKAKKSAGDFEE